MYTARHKTHELIYCGETIATAAMLYCVYVLFYNLLRFAKLRTSYLANIHLKATLYHVNTNNGLTG